MAKRLAGALPGSFPVFVKPNAGLPRADGSGYDITPQLYAMQMKPTGSWACLLQAAAAAPPRSSSSC